MLQIVAYIKAGLLRHLRFLAMTIVGNKSITIMLIQLKRLYTTKHSAIDLSNVQPEHKIYS